MLIRFYHVLLKLKMRRFMFFRLCLLAVSALLVIRWRAPTRSGTEVLPRRMEQELSVGFGHWKRSRAVMKKLPDLDEEEAERAFRPNHGGIHAKALSATDWQRKIAPEEEEMPSRQSVRLGHHRSVHDTVDDYYAFDDDVKRNPYSSGDESERKFCRRTSWHRNLPINCNSLHEFDLMSITADNRMNYLE